MPGKTNLRTYCIRTFGCQMNTHDSEHIAGVLEEAGMQQAPDGIEGADLVVFNTCSVRHGAERRVWGNLLSLRSRSEGGPLVAVGGCMAQRYGRGILERAPCVDLVFGVSTLRRLPELVNMSVDKRLVELGDLGNAEIDKCPSARTKVMQAWVPVSYGCDNSCSYCVVPMVRGKHRSRPAGQILEEVRRLVSQGVVEVTLLGQNVNDYGRDLPEEIDFPSLLEKIAGISGIVRVKFETSHPANISPKLLEAMAENQAVCEYLHIPVQSGSDRVLDAMQRGYHRDSYLETVRAARELVPSIVVSTDIIVGYPGETDSDFFGTLDLVKEVGFDMAYMFKYSMREGTLASLEADDVPAAVKAERLRELQKLQGDLTRRSLSQLVGRTVEVLVEGRARKGDFNRGRSRDNRVVLLPVDEAPVESLVRARVTSSGDHCVTGTVEEVLADRSTKE